MQTYLGDLEMLGNEAENIVMSALGAPIPLQTKQELMEKFVLVVERMKPVHEYVSQNPEFECKAACANAYTRLKSHMLVLLGRNLEMYSV